MENTKTAVGMTPIGNSPGKTKGQVRAIRSAVTNGTRAFVTGNGNSPWARRQRDLISLHAEDAGGLEFLSAAKLSLCHRAAALETELEMLEGRMSLGQEVDLDQYGRLAGHLRRILETLGTERVAREAKHVTLDQYLNARYGDDNGAA